jgi:hypothetical protein
VKIQLEEPKKFASLNSVSIAQTTLTNVGHIIGVSSCKGITFVLCFGGCASGNVGNLQEEWGRAQSSVFIAAGPIPPSINIQKIELT